MKNSAEKFEILDESDKPIGKTVDKNELHKAKNWHEAAHVWIINSNQELLLQKRALTVTNHAGEWDISAAGHVRAGDSVLQTAERELQEELGIKLTPQDFKFLFEVRQQVSRPEEPYFNYEINKVYLVELDLDIEKLVLQKEEVSEVKFVSIDEFKRMISDPKSNLVPHKEEYKKLLEYLSKNSSA